MHRFHEARDWICLQDPTQHTYQALLNHCKTLQQRCEQLQKAQAKDHTELITLSTVASTSFLLHQDTRTT